MFEFQQQTYIHIPLPKKPPALEARTEAHEGIFNESMDLRRIENHITVHKLLHLFPVSNTHFPDHLHYGGPEIFKGVVGVLHSTDSVCKNRMGIAGQWRWEAQTHWRTSQLLLPHSLLVDRLDIHCFSKGRRRRFLWWCRLWFLMWYAWMDELGVFNNVRTGLWSRKR